MVVFDATMLLLLLRPGDSGRPTDSLGQPIIHVQERIESLVKRLERTKIRIIIPTPALSEVLVHAGKAGPQIVEILNKQTAFKIMPFDTLAAIEAALMTKAAIDAGDKKGGRNSPWAKVKFDRQIVAIAKVARATMIYSDDRDVRTLAALEDIPVTGLAELSIPPEKAQAQLPLEVPTEEQVDVAPPEDDEPIDETDETDPDRSVS